MQLPVKAKKAKPRNRFFNYFLFEKGFSVFLQKRNENDIWRNLYQLPLIETSFEMKPEELLASSDFTNLISNSAVTLMQVSKPYRHILTHQHIYARFYHFRAPEDFDLSCNNIQILKKDISKFAVPRLIEIFLTDNGYLNTDF